MYNFVNKYSFYFLFMFSAFAINFVLAIFGIYFNVNIWLTMISLFASYISYKWVSHTLDLFFDKFDKRYFVYVAQAICLFVLSITFINEEILNNAWFGVYVSITSVFMTTIFICKFLSYKEPKDILSDDMFTFLKKEDLNNGSK